MTKTTVAIIGGGISGLSAAYALHKRQVPYLLLEAGAEPRRGDPDRDARRVPARGRAGLDARAEAGGHRPLPRARPRRAPRSHEPGPALRLHPPPAEAPPASRGDDAGRPDEDPALRPQRPVLLAGQAPHGPRPRDPGRERARRRVDRLLPAAAVRAGGGRSPRRAAARRHPRRRPRAALDPRHLPALPRPRGEARQPRARDVGDAAAEARRRGRSLPPPSTRCAGACARWWTRSWCASTGSRSGRRPPCSACLAPRPASRSPSRGARR